MVRMYFIMLQIISSFNDSVLADLFTHVEPRDDKTVADYTEMRSFTTVQNPVCKPCISLHKDQDSGQENAKSTSVNENGVVRSSYFLKKSREGNGKENKSATYKNGASKLENVVASHVYEPRSALVEGTCRQEEQTVGVHNSYFQHKRSSYFKVLSENSKVPESEDLVNGGGDAAEPSGYSIRERLSSNSSLECTTKKRKIAQTRSPTVRLLPSFYSVLLQQLPSVVMLSLSLSLIYYC